MFLKWVLSAKFGTWQTGLASGKTISGGSIQTLSFLTIIAIISLWYGNRHNSDMRKGNITVWNVEKSSHFIEDDSVHTQGRHFVSYDCCHGPKV